MLAAARKPDFGIAKITEAAKHWTLFGGQVHALGFDRYSFGERDADWTLRELAQRRESAVHRHLPTIAQRLGIRDFLAPSPVTFNAEICKQHRLTTLIQVGAGTRGPVVRRGVEADGCVLMRTQGYAASIAGCAVVVLWEPLSQICLATHVGLRSAVNYHRLEERANLPMPQRKATPRGFETVVENALRFLMGDAFGVEPPAHIKAAVLFPIRDLRYAWDHPAYGKLNKLACEHIYRRWGASAVPTFEAAPEEGVIDLGALLISQLEHYGIKEPELIDAPSNRLGERWYTTQGTFPARRNLVVVAYP